MAEPSFRPNYNAQAVITMVATYPSVVSPSQTRPQARQLPVSRGHVSADTIPALVTAEIRLEKKKKKSHVTRASVRARQMARLWDVNKRLSSYFMLDCFRPNQGRLVLSEKKKLPNATDDRKCIINSGHRINCVGRSQKYR